MQNSEHFVEAICLYSQLFILFENERGIAPIIRKHWNELVRIRRTGKPRKETEDWSCGSPRCCLLDTAAIRRTANKMDFFDPSPNSLVASPNKFHASVPAFQLSNLPFRTLTYEFFLNIRKFCRVSWMVVKWLKCQISHIKSFESWRNEICTLFNQCMSLKIRGAKLRTTMVCSRVRLGNLPVL